MAKLKLNALLNQVTGSVGRITIKQTPHGPVVSGKPKKNKKRKWSGAQKTNRARMGQQARWFYRHQMEDPVRAAHYKARAKQEKIPVSAFVMGGFMKYGENFAVMEAPGEPPGGQFDGRDGGDAE